MFLDLSGSSSATWKVESPSKIAQSWKSTPLSTADDFGIWGINNKQSSAV